MTIKGSAAVARELIRVYPKETVVSQLGQLYRNEIRRVLEEAGMLLPQYRERVDSVTYARSYAKLMLIEAYLHDDSVSVRALEQALKYMLKQQQVFADATS